MHYVFLFIKNPFRYLPSKTWNPPGISPLSKRMLTLDHLTGGRDIDQGRERIPNCQFSLYVSHVNQLMEARKRGILGWMRSSLVRMRSSLLRMRSSLVRMRSSLVVRASDCQCTSCNGPGFDPSICRHSGIWGAADEAVLNIVRKKEKNPPPQKKKIWGWSVSVCVWH